MRNRTKKLSLGVIFLLLVSLNTAFAERITYLPMTVDFPQMTVKTKILALEPLDLLKDRFEIWEDGVKVENVLVLTSQAKQAITILLDRSSSLESNIAEVKRAARGLVEALPKEVKLSVISFASDIDINQDFTFDKNKIFHSIDQIRAWGGTVLYDASYLACEQMHFNSEPRDLRTLILFTDGRDETPVTRKQMSTRNFEDVLKIAQRQNIRIIPVSLGNDIDEGKLREFAEKTNGFYLHAPTVKELFVVYQKLAKRMKMENILNLGYFSPHPQKDGKKHSLKIKCTIQGREFDRELEYEAPLDPKFLDVVPNSPLSIAPPKLLKVATPSTPLPTPPPLGRPLPPQIRDRSIWKDHDWKKP